MNLCSQCGNLMLRLDDDFFWQSFDKDHFQCTPKVNCPPAPTTGADAVEGKISIRLNPGQYRFTQLNKLFPQADISPWRESPLLVASRARILRHKKSGKGNPDPLKPQSLDSY